MALITTILAFIVAIGLLVTIHELGHYAAARACGVRILRFSLGFGKALLIHKQGPDQTEWVLAALPLGGYVKMADERDGSATEADHARAFNNKPIWARAIIILAGPLANLLLAAVLYWALFVVGTPGIKPYLSEPLPQTAAATAGFTDFDLIRSIGGKPVATWNDARMVLLEHAVERGQVAIEIEAPSGRIKAKTLDLAQVSKEDLDGDFVGKLGLAGYRGKVTLTVQVVGKGTPAERAGILVGDKITGVNGQPITKWVAFAGAARASPERELSLTIERQGATRELNVTPESVAEFGVRIGRVGISPKIEMADSSLISTQVRSGPIESIGLAVVKVWDMSIFSLKMFGKMLTGAVSWKNLSGPITIADYAGQAASRGILQYVEYLALISISIGVLNLLPIPVLDGGQLMYHIAEFIKGRPLSDRTIEIGQQIGLALLLGLTAFAFFNDINRLLSG